MFFLGVALLGVVSLGKLSVDLLPDLAYPKLTVWTTYADAGPMEIEEFITRPIEEAASTVAGLRRVRSVSREGLSLVTLDFQWGVDMDFASLAVREKLDQLRWVLPREAGRPSIVRLDPRSQPVMAVSLAGDDLLRLRGLARDVFKRRLEQLKGVAMAVVTGGLEREIHVDVDTRRLATFGLSLEQLSAALAAANSTLPGGTIKRGIYRYSLRALGEFQSPEEISTVVVGRSRDGALVRVADVASVEDAFRERESITRFNGKESIGLLVKKEAGANAVEVSRRVRTVLAQLRAEYPTLQVAVAYDQADFISNALANVKQALFVGGLLAFFVLFFFLHDVRQPMSIGLSMPLSILAALILFYFAGVNLNVMSLGGLALGIGMLVDNSIIVLENIFRHRQARRTPESAAVVGAKEVAMPVLASTLTTVAVFLPVVYVRGVAGKLFRDQALAVSFSLLASLVVSLTLLPMLLSRAPGRRQLRGRKSVPSESRPSTGPLLFLRQLGGGMNRLLRPCLATLRGVAVVLWAPMGRALHKASSFSDQMLVRVTALYEQSEAWVLDHARWALLAVLGISLLGGVMTVRLPREFMPRVDQGEFVVEVEAPVGATLEATAERVGRMEQWLLSQPEVEAVFSTIGLIEDPLAIFTEEAALHRGKVHVRLRRGRHRSTWELMAAAREQAPHLSDARVHVREPANVLQQLLGTTEPPVVIKIQGEDFRLAAEVARRVEGLVRETPGLKGLQEQWEEGRPEVRIQIDRERAAMHGLSLREVASFIQHSVKGRVATQFKDFDQKIDVLVRPRAQERDDIEKLLAARLHASRTEVPLRELIRYHYTQGPTEIRREDQVRELVLAGSVEGRATGEVLQDIARRLEQFSPPPDYRVVLGGEREELRRSFRSLAYALLLSVILIYMILAAQFESLRHPFIIMLDVPLTLATLGLLFAVLGLALNTITLIALIVLGGIGVNDSIVKVDFTNQLRRQGVPLRQAILEAGKIRLRPILMTSVTTILGLVPMGIGWGQGAELQRPLAVALITGLCISTVVTLLVVPVLYMLTTPQRH